MVDLPRFIPTSWLGPRRTQATPGHHRHKTAPVVNGFADNYVSEPLFDHENDTPVDMDALMEILEGYGLNIDDFVGPSGGGGVTSHHDLTGLSADDHPQYLTEAEADAIYSALGHSHGVYLTEAEADALYSALGHTHSYAAIGHNHDSTYVNEGDPTFVRGSRTITTGSLAANAEETGTVAFAAGFRLMTIDVDRACRVRLYKSSAARTADATRAVGTDINIATDHGLILEYVSSGAIAAMLSPLVDGFAPSSTTIYYAIQNRSASSHTVAAVFDWLRTE